MFWLEGHRVFHCLRSSHLCIKSPMTHLLPWLLDLETISNSFQPPNLTIEPLFSILPKSFLFQSHLGIAEKVILNISASSYSLLYLFKILLANISKWTFWVYIVTISDFNFVLTKCVPAMSWAAGAEDFLEAAKN